MVQMNSLWTSARVSEVEGVASRMVLKYEENDWTSDPKLQTLFAELKEKQIQMRIAIDRITTKSELEELDLKRDNAVRSLGAMTKAYALSPDAEMSEPGAKLNAIFENYGLGITRESYVEESSKINSMLEDFRQEEINDIVQLNAPIASCITALEQAQANFESARISYETRIAKEGESDSASGLKPVVLDVINKGVNPYLQAVSAIEPEVYNDLALTIAQMIDDTNMVIKKRKVSGEITDEL